MKKFLLAISLITGCLSLQAQTNLKSPADFLGYELGARFTPHYRVVEYFRHVQENAGGVTLNTYGFTNENRPLIYATVTSEENLKNLEQIRIDNLKRAGSIEGTASGNKIAIVWLSYNVHGNEANSTEASMKTLWELVNPKNLQTKVWLKNTVVILDPCVNPDGRDRYVNFYNQYGNTPATSDPQSKEHHEPWPGGRANHYLFDLNRDWAWITQTESIARLKVYNQWLPHVHVDFHEQSPNSPYYFAPAAEPYHEVITPWQREFQVIIGKNNAKYFDEQGWLYFTKERFDLFYPSYGDTYPTYSGAIGMTYEKAGGGVAGLTYTTREGDPITLKDRLSHHYTTGISTIEISSANATKLVDEFEKYNRETSTNPPYLYKSYVIKGDNNPDKLKRITDWMSAHTIKFGYGAVKSARGFEYRSQNVTNFQIASEDIVVNIYQPKGRFINTVFEPQSKLVDSLTYDITAWSLIYAYDLNAYAVTEKIPVTRPYQAKALSSPTITAKPYSYIVRYQSLRDVEFLAALMQKGIKARAAQKSFSISGESFEAGSLIITRRNNESVADFDNTVQSVAKSLERNLFSSSTGFVEKGSDFGSGDVSYLKPPKIAVLGGDQTWSLGFGEIWHFFEQQIHYPITIIGTEYYNTVNLWDYNVIIVPGGRYTAFDEDNMVTLQRWVSDGGKLVIMSSALNSFADKKGFDLKEYATDDGKKDAETKEKEAKQKEGPLKYSEAERKQLSGSIFGAIYKVLLDRSHPLAFGLGEYYYTLKTGEQHYVFLENGWNVGIIKGPAKPVLGYAGFKINKKLENSLVFGVEEKGKGQIVYLVDNPLFRSFWENGKMVFANAIFMVGH